MNAQPLPSLDLDTDAPLFKALAKNPPEWWRNLKEDPDFYIDIRKGNLINVYYNGGSLMRLSASSGGEIKVRIHSEFIPLAGETDEGGYLEFELDSIDNLVLPECKPIVIENFKDGKVRQAFKNKIARHYSGTSEKGIQGKYVTSCRKAFDGNAKGLFIDTEFQSGHNLRIDLVWLNVEEQNLYFVELKTIGDTRLYGDKLDNSNHISEQMKKYHEFLIDSKLVLQDFYEKLLSVKIHLGLLPENLDVKRLNIVEKPILLIGDCDKAWLNADKRGRNEVLNACATDALGCVFQGIGTSEFRVPTPGEQKQQYYRY